jgi:hypothetical protein
LRHGTITVELPDPRMTVAFRVVPVRRSPHQFIVHHEDSPVVKNAVESIRQYEIAVEQLGMLDCLRGCIRVPPPAAGPAERMLYDAGQQLLRSTRTDSNLFLVHFLLDSLETILANREASTPDALQQVADRLESDMSDWIRRLRQLVAAAPARSGISRMLAEARNAGLDVAEETEVREQDGVLLGWLLRMRQRH